jgi:hypothetical protein
MTQYLVNSDSTDSTHSTYLNTAFSHDSWVMSLITNEVLIIGLNQNSKSSNKGAYFSGVNQCNQVNQHYFKYYYIYVDVPVGCM